MTRTFIVAALALGSAAILSTGAFAAEAVIGGKLAPYCYQIAETGGDAQAGVDVCSRALRTDSLGAHDRAATLVNLGVLQSRLDDHHAALATYDKALQTDGALAEAYVDRSAALIALKDYSAAYESADKGLSLGTRTPELAYYNRAIAEEGMGNNLAAYHDLRQAVALTPGFTRAADELKRFHVVRASGSA